VLVAPSTILRWGVRSAEDFSQLWRQFEGTVGRSWRCDETYIKVGGRWMYLYRAVDGAWPHDGMTPQPHTGHHRRQSIVSEGSQATRTTSDHHAGRFRTEPFRATPNGHAQRIQYLNDSV